MLGPAPVITYKCIIYLKTGQTIGLETTDPDATSSSIIKHIDAFHNRKFFRTVPTVIKLVGTPNAWIPIDNINFFSITQELK